jgi:hypothetical protein
VYRRRVHSLLLTPQSPQSQGASQHNISVRYH